MWPSGCGRAAYQSRRPGARQSSGWRGSASPTGVGSAIIRALAIVCASTALILVGAADARAPVRSLGAWGAPGTAPGQFNVANGIAVDDAGRVYVADENNNRVQEFDTHGRLLKVIGALMPLRASEREVARIDRGR